MKRKATLALMIGLGALVPVAYVHGQDENTMIEAPSDVAAVPDDAQKTDSGLASKVLTKGTGNEKPAAADEVTVHYSGWTTDGKLFDSSVKRGQPATFPLNGVIKGWTEGLQLMTVGEKRRFWIPADLAYGENPGGGRPGGLLVFDVELLDIKAAPKPPEDVAEVPAEAKKTESGLAYRILKSGEGDSKPAAHDIAEMHFSMWSKDGQLLESSQSHGRPLNAPINTLPFEGLQEALTLMTPGEQSRFWIPQALTFGENIPPGAPEGHLVFDIELISFKEAPEPPKVPEDVAAIPDSATKTASGLASRVLEKGTGDTNPKATDTVSVHYSGWTLDGKMFDSSVSRGEPTSFPLNGVIPGWTEGVQLMTVGEKRRFWIPADLAYGENPGGGRPGGMLVFDIELLEIK
ncbi:FKBP-type peptidyl-prolyl cis-trans isomerase [Luteolibacter algae]|uniref:peptidylprolyl isomerase n=1 Tax=Luteolibacter algae TaxID=454151 RepID=A0ABW5D224_9BACT